MVEEPRLNQTHDTQGSQASEQALDAAGESLGNALRLSFRVLAVCIALLVIIFFARGWFRVEAGQRAIVLQFGQADESRVKDEGLAYALPYPIHEKIVILTQQKSLDINTFWPERSEQSKEEAQKGKAEPDEYIPGAMGALLLTGDRNMIESRWSIGYEVIDDPTEILNYYNNVGVDQGYPYGDDRRYGSERELLRLVLHAAVVQHIASKGVDEVYPNQGDFAFDVMAGMNAMLGRHGLKSGIEVVRVNIREIRPPLVVKPAFDEKVTAVQEADRIIEAAQKDARRILILGAGPQGEKIGEKIKAWWAAWHRDDADEMKRLDEEIGVLLEDAKGEVENLLQAAKAYEREVKRDTEALAARVRELVEKPDASAEAINLFLQQRHVVVMQDVLENAYETFVFRPMDGGTRGTMEIWLDREPSLLREKARVPETK